jgi:hypothetical protein
LSNGNYVVRSWRWDNGAAANAGAVTWGNGVTGTVGVVSATNSLVGSSADDQVGFTVGTSGVTELSNGNYVVVTMIWNNGAVLDAGAVTWCSGKTGRTGAVSTSNSLVGSKDFDNVGSHGVTALSNGSYVVGSMRWDNSTVVNAGAATWGSGTTGVTGAVSATNSLVGSTLNDNVGQYIIALSNGSYVVRSPIWNNSTVVDAGAVTWGSGTTGRVGVISATNSLVGSKANDKVGDPRVTALSNGNYVVGSPNWDNGAVTDAGAATWGNGTTGTVGVVSATNSLVGSTTSDQVGLAVTALSNGNFVVLSAIWDNGAAANAGAVTWGNGTTGVTGAISSTNSLVGSTANDQVGYPGEGVLAVTALSNGNYVVSSGNWDNGSVTDVGAATWGNGTTGITGAVSAANSLVGSTANDRVSRAGVTALSNGNYVVQSSLWSNSGASGAGAATWGNGTTGIVGAVSLANSLTGSKTNDGVGGQLTAFSNGNYVMRSVSWDNGALTNSGAVTVAEATGPFGVISAANSVLGTASYYGSELVFSYDASADRLVVGQPRANRVTVLDKRPTVTEAPTDITIDSGTIGTFTASATGDPVPTLQWQVSVNSGVDWTDVSGATASPYTFTASAGDTGKKYRAVFTNSAGSTFSSAATMTVVRPAAVISTWPSATAISYGQTLASSTLSGGTASVAGTFAFTSPGTIPAVGTADQAVTFTPTDGANYATVSGTVSVTVNVVQSNQELWRFTNFGSYDSAGSAADSADPDGDGLNNLLEYALGTAPNTSGVMLASLASSGANLEYTYTRSTAAKDNGVTYQIEWSDTLAAGSWSTQTVTQEITSTQGALETVKASVPKGTGGKRFLRLKVQAVSGN